jgi:hypothetical protein
MKLYPSIKGPKHAPRTDCICFRKYDGSNIRAEWNKKSGWFKFGTRHRLFDKSDPDYGEAIDLFMQQHSDLEKVFADKYPHDKVITVFCEFFGKESFAGQHVKGDPKTLMLFEVEIHKKGFVLPREFANNFCKLNNVAEVVYEGPFTEEFIALTRGRKPPELEEGVVAKGLLEGRKATVHSLWMSKVKTSWWLDEVRNRCSGNEDLKKLLEENEREQL